MTRVEFLVYDEEEYTILRRAEREIEAYRDQLYSAGEGDTQATASVDVPAVPIAQAIEEAYDEIATPPLPAKPPAEVSEADAIKAAQKYAEQHGIPGVRKLLDEIGVARVTDLTAEQRVAFVQKATA